MDDLRHSSKEKFDMFVAYEDEMSQYFYPNHKLGTMEDRMKHISFYTGAPTHLWYDIFCRGAQVGFFMVCTTPDDCHPDYDYTILDAYVKPEYRKNGFLSLSLIAFIKANPGKYCLVTYKGNDIAKRVFDNIFINKMYYRPSSPRFVPNARDFNTTLIGYEPPTPVRRT